MNDQFVQCFICKSTECTVRDVPDNGTKKYDCKRCGRYTITYEAIRDVENIPSALSGWLRERNLYGIEIPTLTSSFLEEVTKTLPRYSPSEKQNKLLKAIEKCTDYPGQIVELIPEFDISLAWAENKNEFKYYVRSLINLGLVERSNAILNSSFSIIITTKGWEYLEKNCTGYNYPFGDSNQQISDHKMQNQLRLKKQIDDLQHQWELHNEKLSGLNEQWILETRFEEKLRLRKLIENTQTQHDQVEEQLKNMESQLAKVSDAKEVTDRNDDQGRSH